MHDDQTRFPARPLFVIEARGMAGNRLHHQGPMGGRSVASPIEGTFEGRGLYGRIGKGLASEWQLESGIMPGLAFVEGYVALVGDDGLAFLMKYIGRRRPCDGSSKWRVAVGFEAPMTPAYDWLNDIVAVAEIEHDGDDLRYVVHELLGRRGAVDDHALRVEPLYRMVAGGSVGERHIVASPISTRYLTIAEEGCATNGRLNATWPAGFAWGPHRTARDAAGAFALPLHIDMRAGMVTEPGDLIIQQYLGTTPRAAADAGGDQSWLTVATFEAPVAGDNAWLNEVIALGTGWVEGGEAHYDYRIWC